MKGPRYPNHRKPCNRGSGPNTPPGAPYWAASSLGVASDRKRISTKLFFCRIYSISLPIDKGMAELRKWHWSDPVPPQTYDERPLNSVIALKRQMKKYQRRIF
jgi:hypothetical protein